MAPVFMCRRRALLGRGIIICTNMSPKNCRRCSKIIFRLTAGGERCPDIPWAGHGALIIALRNPDNYRSVSAFAPICSPMNCPWGEKALGNYLGDDKQTWREYDACALVADAAGKKFELLVEQGTADDFLETQLKPQLLTAACKKADYPLTLNMRDGYDHSYYFIATFIGEHIAFHARHLSA